MDNFRIFINLIVILGMGYLTFAMTLSGWVAGLKRGEAVTLLPEQKSRTRNLWFQMGLVAVSLALVLVLGYLLWIRMPFKVTPQLASGLSILGLVFFVVGTLTVVWARQTLGRMWGISTSREVKLLPDHRLVKDGPYEVIRHPMYSGWWLALLGATLIYRTWILVLLLIFSVFVFARRARLEEKVLSERFGAEWQEYVQSTRSLIPFIY